MRVEDFMESVLQDILHKYQPNSVGYLYKNASKTYFIKVHNPKESYMDISWSRFECEQIDRFNNEFERYSMSLAFIPEDFFSRKDFQVLDKEIYPQQKSCHKFTPMVDDSFRSIMPILIGENGVLNNSTIYAMAA